MRSATIPLAALCLACLCAAFVSGCARGCPPPADHGPAVVAELQARRATLKAERRAATKALAAEARNQRGISEKSGRYEYLRAECERLEREIRSIDCEIYPH